MYLYGSVSKPCTPGEHQNIAGKMDVHPIKNGINRYWSDTHINPPTFVFFWRSSWGNAPRPSATVCWLPPEVVWAEATQRGPMNCWSVLRINYSLVMSKDSYWTCWFIVDFIALNMVIFHSYVSSTRGYPSLLPAKSLCEISLISLDILGPLADPKSSQILLGWSHFLLVTDKQHDKHVS